MSNNLFSFSITVIAFSLFIVCPRMAAMTNLITKHFGFSVYWVVIIGTLVSAPLLVVMTWIIKQWGLIGGLGFAILTDLLSVVVIGTVNTKVAIETFIIALFVVLGNRIAMWLSAKFF